VKSLHRRLLVGLMIVLMAVGSALPVVRNNFVQDDSPLVREDARIHDLGNIRQILTTPFWPMGGAVGHHRPMMTLTLALEWAMGNGAPVTYKIVSLTLYALSALAVFLLALELLPMTWAALAAMAFAVHPVHIEAIAVAINQGELIIGLGYTLTVTWYLRMRRQRLPNWRDRWLLGLAVLTACFIKETGVVLPALLGAVELLLLPPAPWRDRIRHFRPTVLVQVLAVMIVVYVRGAVLGDLRGTFTAEGLEGLNMGGRALTMLGVVPEYLRLLLWPASLQADYSPQAIVGTTHWGAAQTLGALILVLVGVLAVRLWRKAPVVVFGLAWVAIGIAPVHNVLVPSGIVLAERTLFLPSIGAMITVAGLLAGVEWPTRGRVREAVYLGIAVVLALGASRSWSRAQVWRTEIGLWTQTVIDAPDSYRAWIALGSLMIRPEHTEMAIRFTKRGVDLFPNAGVVIGLAQRYQANNQCNLAIPVFQQALRLKEFAPGRAEYLSCLTWEGQYDLAYREAMRGITTGRYHTVFRIWRRYLEELRRERPPRHTRFAPPALNDLLPTALQEPGVNGLYPPLPESP
jgi:protein O-mannosyl-transferase